MSSAVWPGQSDRKDYEVIGPWCELVIEAESPILMHGLVDDATGQQVELLAPLRAARVSFTAECYGPHGEDRGVPERGHANRLWSNQKAARRSVIIA